MEGGPMEIEEVLTRAWKAVVDAGIPEPLQELAFREALDALRDSATNAPVKPRVTTDPINAGSAASGSETPSDPSAARADDLMAKFSSESGVSVHDLERVFYFQEGLPYLVGPRSKLGKTAADQAKAVAVALTAAHDYALDDTAIADSVVRAETNRLKIDVGGNWSRTMNSISGASWIGPARQKQFKTIGTTSEALKRVVAGFLGESSE